MEEIKKKILNGELAILDNGTKQVHMNKEEFRDFISYQENTAIMSDCITLLDGNQIYCDGFFYRLIHGQKLVIDIFEEYAGYFIDSVKEGIEEIWN